MLNAINGKKIFAVLLVSLGMIALPALAQERGLQWNGTIYTKWIDGNRNTNGGLYNNSEFGSGDQGQGTEFEMLFKANVSKKVEIGGRLKARFDQNFWSNGGGFADDENNPRSAQYVKFRGAYVSLKPGYNWIDSATIGSNDWGQFDGFTLGKIRYIDRDNVSGLLFQGSTDDKRFRYDVARVSLPKLWAGPNFSTGDLHQMDAAYAAQGKFEINDSLNITAIYEYINDNEIDPTDVDNRDGVEEAGRYENTVWGVKFAWTSDHVDVRGAYYYSDFDLGDDFFAEPTLANGDPNPDYGMPRFTPTLAADDSDSAIKLNIDLNDLGPFSLSAEYFNIGASYMSMMAARRETDVLLTEGVDGAWGWSRPDYNYGSNDRGNSRNTIGYGGWDGASHQVVSLNADNDFTDFDESYAQSVLGWKGFTLVPRLSIGDLELEVEYTYVDYNSNWQGGQLADDNPGRYGSGQTIHPTMDGVRSWGVGGDYRSPFSTYSEKETSIFVLRGGYLIDVGNGIDLDFKFKTITDEDDRVTDASKLGDAYRQSVVDHVNYDDREADYTTYTISFGYQLHRDLYASFAYEHYEVDLFDGTIDVTPPNMDGWEPEFGWIAYMTGQHDRDKLMLKLKYFLSGMEFGLNVQQIDGSFDPEFYTGSNGSVNRLSVARGDVVGTAVGQMSTDKVDFDHFRLKAFMKVQF